jgi:hypothetical protein
MIASIDAQSGAEDKPPATRHPSVRQLLFETDQTCCAWSREAVRVLGNTSRCRG